MDQDSLVTERIDAAALFLAEFDRFAPVATAFWLKSSEDVPWYLYVASDGLDADRISTAYAEVLRIAAVMKNPAFEAFQVKLIPTTHPFAEAALRVLRQFPGRMATRLRGRVFGGICPEEVCNYPMPVAVP